MYFHVDWLQKWLLLVRCDWSVDSGRYEQFPRLQNSDCRNNKHPIVPALFFSSKENIVLYAEFAEDVI